MNRLQTIDADTLQSTAYEPVSYTHLDVYKRQDYSWNSYIGTQCPGFIEYGDKITYEANPLNFDSCLNIWFTSRYLSSR